LPKSTVNYFCRLVNDVIFSYDSRYHGLKDMQTWFWTNP